MSKPLPPLPPLLEAIDANPDDVARALERFKDLLAQAEARYRQEIGPVDAKILDDIRKGVSEDGTSEKIEERLEAFVKFRKEGESIRTVLKPLVQVLSLFCDVTAEAAASHIPGGKSIIVAIGVLLKVAGEVSKLYDIVQEVIGQIQAGFTRFETYLRAPATITPALSKIIVDSLVTTLELLSFTTKYCKDPKHRRESAIWRRIRDYKDALLGKQSFRGKARELKKLTDVELKHVVAENYALNQMNRAGIFRLEDTEETRRIRSWINPTDHEAGKHQRLGSERHDLTCEWILDDKDFLKWKDSPNSVFKIVGHAGSGKSVLCSLIIQELQNDPTRTFTFAYFYFNRLLPNPDNHNNRDILIRSLLFQIASSSAVCWDYLKQQCPETKSPPSLMYKHLLDMLCHVLEVSGPTVIVIDALDECLSQDSRFSHVQESMLQFLEDLNRNKTLKDLHMLVTSRPEPRIVRCLARLDAARQSLDFRGDRRHLRDVKDYVTHKLSLQDWSEDIRKAVEEELSNPEKNQGIFLWVTLQLRDLEHCATASQILQTLDALPVGLDETYHNILHRFGSNAVLRSRVRSVLSYIAFSRNEVTVEQVASALNFDFDKLEFDDERSPNTDHGFILQRLPSLIEIGESVVPRLRWRWHWPQPPQFVRFFHLSVKEYLTSNRLREHPDVQDYYFDRYFADIAIATLLMATLSQLGPSMLDYFPPNTVTNWYDYVTMDPTRLDNDTSRPDAEARRKAAERLDRALTSFLNPSCRYWMGIAKSSSLGIPLYYAVKLGLQQHTECLLQQYPTYPNPDRHDQPSVISILAQEDAKGPGGYTAQHFFAQTDDRKSLKELLGSGADPNVFSDDGHTPLHLAAQTDHFIAALYLTRPGAQLDLTRNGCLTPLQYAVALGHQNIVGLLGEGGVDMDAEVKRLKEHGIERAKGQLGREDHKRVWQKIREVERELARSLKDNSDDD